jgi:hypothetical protein
MNTNDVLHSLEEAIAAFHAKPELDRQIKSITEDRDFIKLELDEARAEIERLKSWNAEQISTIAQLREAETAKISEIRDLRSRNEMLDQSLSEANARIRDLEQDKSNAGILIQLLEADKQALTDRLADSKSYASRLAEMLKGFGSAIASAVAEPEVSAETPFPAANPVGLPIPAEPSIDVGSNNSPVPEPSSTVELASEIGEVLVTEKPAVQPEPFPGYTTQPGIGSGPASSEAPSKPWWDNG